MKIKLDRKVKAYGMVLPPGMHDLSQELVARALPAGSYEVVALDGPPADRAMKRKRSKGA